MAPSASGAGGVVPAIDVGVGEVAADEPEAPGPSDERCGDGVDNDGDGLVDEGGVGEISLWPDVDGDGWGDGAVEARGCAPIPGWAVLPGDCDDAAADVHPAADDACDARDNDCDGGVDEDATFESWFPDADGDGFGVGEGAQSTCAEPVGWRRIAGDCDDRDSGVFPGAAEVCDGRDQDCDALADEELPVFQWYRDLDGDGFGGEELGAPTCGRPVGAASATAGDCDDRRWDVRPGAVEVCDGVDQDCDAAVDDGLPTTQWYHDLDEDGWGGAPVGAASCEAPAGPAVEVSGDCDDLADDVNPDGIETCDDRDQDCDGQADDGARRTMWQDNDGDGFGDGVRSPALRACDAAGWVPNDDDCHDGDEERHPDAVEDCDAVDDDCDGEIDDELACGATSVRFELDDVLYVSPDVRRTFHQAQEWCESRGYHLWAPPVGDDRVIREGTDTWDTDVWVGATNTCVDTWGDRYWGRVVPSSCRSLGSHYESHYALDTTDLTMPFIVDRWVFSDASRAAWNESPDDSARRDVVCMKEL